jgi:cell pole-organizing protein PopZ
MSKADPTGESLESILASIRRSLAEQSTDILNEDTGTAPEAGYEPQPMMPGEDDLPRLFGGAGAGAPALDTAPRKALPGRALEDPTAPAGAAPAHLAPVHVETPARAEIPARPVEEPPPPAPMSLAAPAPAQGSKDALWFLGRSDAPAESTGVQVAAPRAQVQPAAAEAKPIRTEIVRGPLPPFFGSSAEAAKVEVAPVPDIAPTASVMPPFPPPPAARGLAGDPLPGPVTSPVTNPTPEAATGQTTHSFPGLRAGAATRDGLPNGKAASFLGQPAMDGRAAAADGPPQFHGLQGLEAMVAELLRPMLRRWLDENMPRLVSAALKAEAELMARRDPKKP